jgi:uroporphyrinogen III methyltransferase/synthase
MVQKTPSLKGKTIALTRPAGQAEEAGKLIVDMGGVPYYIPAIEIKGLSNIAPVKKFFAELERGQVDYVILMSTNGVKYLFEAADKLERTKLLQEGLGKAFVIAVGPRTAQALHERDVRVDLVPTKYSSEGLIESFQGIDKKAKYPHTTHKQHNPNLTKKLKEIGANVEKSTFMVSLPVDETENQVHEDLTAEGLMRLFSAADLAPRTFSKCSLKRHPWSISVD